MDINVQARTLMLRADTESEYQMLVAFAVQLLKNRKPIVRLQIHNTADASVPTPQGTVKRRKHRVPCPECGGIFKSLKGHLRFKHQAPQNETSQTVEGTIASHDALTRALGLGQ